MNHTLQADSILFQIDGRKILSDVYVKCETGKVTALLGRNGQGKSCLMNTIYGISAAESKSIRFDNVSVPNPHMYPDLLRYLPQKNFIPQSITLRRLFSDFDISYSEFKERFPGFSSTNTTKIGRLSGGERRLVEVYVIVKAQSQFVLLDEPFSYLSPIQIETMKGVINEEKKNKGLLITDHLYLDVVDISDYIYVLVNGKTHLSDGLQGIEKHGYLPLTVS
ncbi:MAG: transporter ATP-binding protein [Sediminibacterium sp.]|nr:transporter ATP-binding protein [Sediminibacterium sp.]